MSVYGSPRSPVRQTRRSGVPPQRFLQQSPSTRAFCSRCVPLSVRFPQFYLQDVMDLLGGDFGGNMSRRRTRTPSGLPRHGVRTARRLTVSSVFSFSRTRSVARFGTVTTLKRPVSTGRRGQAIPIRRRMGGPRERRWDTVGGPECSGGDGHDGSRAPNHEDLQDRRHQQPLPRPPRLNRQAWAGGRVDVYIPASASASASASTSASASASASAWTRSVAALMSARWERP